MEGEHNGLANLLHCINRVGLDIKDRPYLTHCSARVDVIEGARVSIHLQRAHSRGNTGATHSRAINPLESQRNASVQKYLRDSFNVQYKINWHVVSRHVRHEFHKVNGVRYVLEAGGEHHEELHLH